MRGLGTFATRLKRIEAKRRPLREPRRIVFGLYDTTEADVIGVRVGLGQTVDRRPGEAYCALIGRVTANHPRRTLILAYGPHITAREVAPSPWRVELDAAARRAAEPIPEPPDPFALGGIGRRATREELERMGAIPFPPERLY